MISSSPDAKMAQFIKLIKQMDLHQKCIPKLNQNGFDEWDLIKDLDINLLKEIGITNKITQQEILSCVQLAHQVVPSNKEQKTLQLQQQQILQEQQQEKQKKLIKQHTQSLLEDPLALNQLHKGTQLIQNKKKQTYDQFLLSLSNFNLPDKSITLIHNLNKVKNIISLYLYDNQIQVISGLDQCTNIQILRLENNQITSIEGLENLTKLQKLYLNKNHISRIQNLTTQYQLNELQLNNQSVSVPFSFCGDSCAVISESLLILELDSCNIQSLQFAEYLANLHTLSLQNNQLSSPTQLEHLCACLRALKLFKLAGNPLANNTKYRDQVVMMASNTLQELDGKDIIPQQRAFLFKLYNIKNHKAQQEHQKQGTFLENMDIKGDKYL